MTLRVSGKNLDIGDSLRAHIENRVRSLLRKYRAGTPAGHVTVEREGSGFRSDCTLHLSAGMTVQADAEAQDAYASFNLAAERLERRVHRFRDRLAGRRSSGSSEMPEARANRPAIVADATRSVASEPGFQPGPAEKGAAVIAEPTSQVREMSVSSAVEELDVTNAPVVVFRHACDGRTNVVYRRPDGNIGWIDPART
jgi:ribosomal subunit interface protein